MESIQGLREGELFYMGDLHLDQCYSKYWSANFATYLWQRKELVPKYKLVDFFIARFFNEGSSALIYIVAPKSLCCLRPESVSRLICGPRFG